MASDEVKNTNQKQEDKKKILTSPAKYFFGGFIVCILIWGGLLAAYCHFHGSKYHYVEQGAVVAIAVLGACVSLYTAAKQEENVDKWNQKKIDADLKARARIEWIQRVRETTTAFISSGYSMIRIINKLDTNKIRECFEIINEKGTLLKLYFGPDESGTNDMVVNKIEEIKSDSECLFKDYVNSDTSERIRKLDNKIKSITVPQIQVPFPMYFDDDDPSEEIMIDIDDEDSEEYKEKHCLQKERFRLMDELNKKKEKLVNNISDFSELIRKYLKNEWKKARDNE